jgi:hypothetical protein
MGGIAVPPTDTMAHDDRAPDTRSRFTFHAANDRLYARNAAGKLVDLGRLAQQADGSWHYLLDGNQLTGGGKPSAESAMAEAAERMGFLYLDGQFTAVADSRDDPALDLSQAPAIELQIEEVQARERMEDARV